MKILIAHNNYQISGGEDSVLASEQKLLVTQGEEVVLHCVSNDGITTVLSKILAAIGVVFSISQYVKFKQLLRLENPNVVHVHNYFPVMSPAIFYACKHMGIPIVHTLHNYRAVCPTALLMHDGRIVEKSIKGSAWWAVPKKVYRGSLLGTFALALMVEVHKKLGTWQHTVDRFITLTEFQKNKYITAGWPAEKLSVKPNFTIDDGDISEVNRQPKAVFVGRLSDEKGINILNEAWVNIDFSLDIIGDGDALAHGNRWISQLGKKEKKYVLTAIGSAQFIVVPSVCYEGFPMAIVESFACGTPVLCSRLGSMEEIVTDGETGLHFEAGNSADLTNKAQWLINNPDECLRMGRNARAEYLEKYTAEKNYEMLMDIYQQAIDEAKKR
ncbi:glycosyl transferase family 1 [Colwellia sp. 75C3]|uniref:glycosyltransferase family 4 protein n=1 Tax=Colwellia sp. 75C3 TaxID=888425 RepID=UPI000C33A89F|nr:glycosyltransferase family 4 protein [Colwellia sp. 75C3]PKG82544.1 glycosyl transferase family 1 [Colwellia sp. 75C3]